MKYYHSYTIRAEWCSIADVQIITLDSDNLVPTIEEFFNAVKNAKNCQDKGLILKGKFAYWCHVTFQNNQ